MSQTLLGTLEAAGALYGHGGQTRTAAEGAAGGGLHSYDRIPHAGEAGGLHHSMGYCGHGVQLATYMAEANPLRGLGHVGAVPFYHGTAWCLPFAGAHYKARYRLR